MKETKHPTSSDKQSLKRKKFNHKFQVSIKEKKKQTMIKAETITKIQNLPIVDIAEKYGLSLKKAGVNYVSHCIWHNDKTPSFVLSPVKGIATCFVCNKTVNGIGLVMDKENLSYPQALKSIASNFNIQVQEDASKEFSEDEKQALKERESLFIANNFAAEYYHKNLLELLIDPKFEFKPYNFAPSLELRNKPPEFKITYKFPAYKTNFESSKTAIAYIKERFSLDEIKRFKLGFAHKGYANFREHAERNGFKREVLLKAGLVKIKKVGGVEHCNDNFVHRPLIIPIQQRNKIVGFGARQWPDNNDYPKYLNTSDTEIYFKSEILYGLTSSTIQAIKAHNKVYIVEGYTDVMQLNKIGIDNVVAKSGTSFTVQQMAILKKLTSNIILLDDGDEAGQKAMLKHGRILCLKGFNVTAIKLEEKEDPGSFFTELIQFKNYEQENTYDYIIDIVASELDAVNSVDERKKIKEKVADLLLKKDKTLRRDYLSELSKKVGIKATEWQKEIQAAAIRSKQEGLNSSEDNEDNVIEFDNSSENFKYHNFYKVKVNQKGENTGITLNRRTFLMRLKSFKTYEFKRSESKTTKIQFGFYSYKFENSEDRIYVQLKNGRIKKVTIDDIKETFFRFVKLLKPIMHEGVDNNGNPWEESVTANMIEELMLEKVQTLFSETSLVLFPDRPIKIIEDSIFNHYTFFKNCYAISNKDGCKVFEYSELKSGYVWEDNVIDRDFSRPESDTIPVFKKFMFDIAGNNFDIKNNSHTGDNTELFEALKIACGYSLHNYSDMERKALILTQGRVAEDDTSEGREGKTLLIDFLGQYMLNQQKTSKTYVKVFGKDLQHNDKHKWGDVELNTKMVLYDDPPAAFDFETLYNTAEDAFKVEKKHQANQYVKARLVITTNRPVNRDSGSSRARSCVIELASCFDANYTPIDKYKKRFGRDWDVTEWNLFSWYVMNEILPAYFTNNCKLVEPINKNLARNEILQISVANTGSQAMAYWLDGLFEEKYFVSGGTYNTNDLLTKIGEDVSYYRNHDKLKNNFTKVLKQYLTKSGYKYEFKRQTKGNKIWNIRGNGIQALPKREQMNYEQTQFQEIIDNDEMPDGFTNSIHEL